jgi:hypothetical protein
MFNGTRMKQLLRILLLLRRRRWRRWQQSRLCCTQSGHVCRYCDVAILQHDMAILQYCAGLQYCGFSILQYTIHSLTHMAKVQQKSNMFDPKKFCFDAELVHVVAVDAHNKTATNLIFQHGALAACQ